MSFPQKYWARIRQSKGQSMTEYALVITGVAVVAVYGGYQQLANTIVGLVNSVIGLF